MSESIAIVGNQMGRGLVEITSDLSCLDGSGQWLVLGFFEGLQLALKFESWTDADHITGHWGGVNDWSSHSTQVDYETAVEQTRQRIAAGDVYQANICRLLSAPWPAESDIAGLYSLLKVHNPAPMSALVSIRDSRLLKWGMESIDIASASPEVFLKRRGAVISSSPIKGTAGANADFLVKDNSENIMIVDLVRNDLSQVCDVATIEVPNLLERQSHPGLAHLVSTVQGELRSDVTWTDIFAATFPPGSVTGAPKSSALKIIKELEGPRSIYCGTIGYVNADTKTADLSVAIRTFWKADDRLWFGTGAGITWGSDPHGEWLETELKSQHLFKVAAMKEQGV